MKFIYRTKHFISLMILLTLSGISAYSQDPNFYIFICFGQSNMEGQGPIETQDQTVNSRFKVMEALDCSGLNRQQGKWYTANPPLVRCNTKLGPADYFGRTLVDSLPSNITIGVIDVAVAGCKIELFDKATYSSYAAGEQQWMKDIIALYNGNPYQRIIDLAKLAQKDGVIKGILLHQGESNSGDTQWPTKVKKIYNDMLTDLGLTAANVPLLAGEVVGSDMGGQCASMNSTIDNLPSTIPTAHVISSKGCTDQSDNLHFTSAGYRELGKRYAQMMLSLLPPPSGSTVQLTSPAASSSFNAPASSITINATATTTSGTITKVEFYYNGTNKIGEDATSPYSVTWTNVPAGNYSLTAIATDDKGNKTTSSAITISVVNTFKIYKTNTAITIDGTIDAAWTNANILPVEASKLLSGTVTNSSDLSGNMKALWDNSYLYILADVIDDALVNDSQNAYDDDAVEVYLDINNDKATSYGTNDFQYTFGWNDGTTVGALPSGRSTTNITYKAVAKTGGYIIEAQIPWSTIQGTPTVGQLVGIDFMINDDDNNSTRDGKISWNADTDNAWQDASLFGTGELKDAIACTPPNTPSVTSPISYSQNQTAVALTASGTNLLWYASESGGTGNADAPIPSTIDLGTKTYYVSQTVGGCESSRSKIDVTITSALQKYSINKGWNLVGCPISGSTEIEKALSSIWSQVETVKNLDSFWDIKNTPNFNSLTKLEWGKGYLIKVKTNCDLDWIVR